MVTRLTLTLSSFKLIFIFAVHNCSILIGKHGRAVRSVNSISPTVRKPGDQPSVPLLVLLTLLLLLTYPLSMLLVELLPPLHQTSFLLVMLKYVVGTSHHLLVPIGILAVRADLRGIVVDIYR